MNECLRLCTLTPESSPAEATKLVKQAEKSGGINAIKEP